MIDLLEFEDITIERRAPGTFVNGKLIQGSQTIVNSQANIQPATGTDLDALPEGDRTKRIFRFYTRVSLQVGNRVLKVSDGVIFKIVNVKDYSSVPFLAHFESLGIL
jgi:hypothetical protein